MILGESMWMYAGYLLEFRLNLHDRSRHTASDRTPTFLHQWVSTRNCIVILGYSYTYLATIDSIAWEVWVKYSPLNINVYP